MILRFQIGTFLEWFVGAVVDLISMGIYYLQTIEITPFVSLWQFITGIILLEIFLGLIISRPFKLTIGEERKDVQKSTNRK